MNSYWHFYNYWSLLLFMKIIVKAHLPSRTPGPGRCVSMMGGQITFKTLVLIFQLFYLQTVFFFSFFFLLFFFSQANIMPVEPIIKSHEHFLFTAIEPVFGMNVYRSDSLFKHAVNPRGN